MITPLENDNTNNMGVYYFPKDPAANYTFNASADIFSLGMNFMRLAPGNGTFVVMTQYLSTSCFTRDCHSVFVADYDPLRKLELIGQNETASEVEFVGKVAGLGKIRELMIGDLALKMIAFDPAARPSLANVIKELFFITKTNPAALLAVRLKLARALDAKEAARRRKEKEEELKRAKAEEAERKKRQKTIKARKLPSYFVDGGAADVEALNIRVLQEGRVRKKPEALPQMKKESVGVHQLIIRHLFNLGKVAKPDD